MAVPQYSRSIDWPTIGLALAMYATLLGNFALYWSAPLSVWIHVLVSVAAIHLSFTIWHESVHRNVSTTRWLNDLVGVFGVFPYMAPYFLERWLHLKHHSRLNQPDDPNGIYTAGPFWQLPIRYLRILAFYRERAHEDPRSREEKIADTLPPILLVSLYALAWWQGVLLDVVLLWLLPVVIAKVIMDWYINYAPHVGLPPDRFKGTRVLDLPWLTPLLLCHNYHAIHHLWPGLPWHRYPPVFREKLAYLRENEVPIETRIVGFRSQPQPPPGESAQPG